MIADAALSAGDTMLFDSNTPGGYRLTNHSTDVTSQSKIMAGSWDYVVIQGQSQEPIAYPTSFNSGGLALYNQVKQYNACAVIMPYMTWGRKNGDAVNCPTFPEMCTYQSMDSSLRARYLSLTASLNGEVSPVSVVWNFLRKNHPTIELYQSDESHPSLAGSYAAACCFYASIFKKDPTLITYTSGLSAGVASAIKNIVKSHVYDSLQLWDFKKEPISDFSYQVTSGVNQVVFSPINQGVRQTYFWDFGDGFTSLASNPSHSYLNDGTYTVSLTTTTCDLQGSHSSFTDTVIQFCSHTPTIFTKQPFLCNYDTLWTQAADAYQWFNYGNALPETKVYLADYAQYNISGFSVLATVAGCSELSVMYTESPLWPGYYFDAIGDPCEGDSVPFAVLHTNGFLSGTEIIHWFKNDVHLPWIDNEDTMYFSGSGKYECKVVNPNTDCPFDTTSYILDVDCSTLGIGGKTVESIRSIFPNPVSDILTIQFTESVVKDELQIFNATGNLVKVMEVSGSTSIDVSDLPGGLYFLRLLKHEQTPLRFIKR